MAIYTNSAAVTAYETSLKLAYQDSGKLRNTVTVRTGVAEIGRPINAPINFNHSQIVSVFLKRVEWFDVAEFLIKQETDLDAIGDMAKSAVKSIERHEDKFIIDAVSGAVFADRDVTLNYGTGAENKPLTLDKLRAAKKMFVQNNVDEEITFVMDASGLEALLETTEVTSNDYNTVKALVQGDVDTFMGFKFVTLGDRKEGGLPQGSISGSRYYYAYVKSSTGLAIGMKGLEPKRDWSPTHQAHIVGASIYEGAGLIDPKGIVRIDCLSTN